MTEKEDLWALECILDSKVAGGGCVAGKDRDEA